MFINLYKYILLIMYFFLILNHALFTINQAIIIIKQYKNAFTCPNLPTSQYILRIYIFFQFIILNL